MQKYVKQEVWLAYFLIAKKMQASLIILFIAPWRGHTQRVFPPDDTGMKAQNSAIHAITMYLMKLILPTILVP